MPEDLNGRLQTYLNNLYAAGIVVGPFVNLVVTLPGGGSPTAQTAAVPFTAVVTAVDAQGRTVTTITHTVAITCTDANAALPSNAALVAGVGTFAVTMKTAGSRTITASDVTDATKGAGTSAAVTINAGAFSKLLLFAPGEVANPGTATGKSGSPNSITPNVAFNVTAKATDANGNLISSATDTVHFASSDGSAVLPSNAALVAGTKVFSVTLVTAQTSTVTLSDVTDATKTSQVVSIVCVTYITLAKAHLSFLGMYNVPVDSRTDFASGAMSARRVGGVLRFFMTGLGGRVIEFQAGTLGANYGVASRPTTLYDYGADGAGNFYGTSRKTWNPSGVDLGDVSYASGLLWYNNLLYWSYNATYNTTGYNLHCFGVTDVSGGVGACTQGGPWQLDVGSKLAGAWMCLIPAAWGDTNANGARIGLGLGLSSGNNGSSWGPNLIALPAPTMSTPGGLGSPVLTTVNCLRYGIAKASRYKRDGDSNPQTAALGGGDFAPDAPGARNGYWNQIDCDQGGPGSAACCVWVDYSDKKGYMALGYLGHGDTWYQIGSQPADQCACGGYYGSRGPTGKCPACGCVQGPVAQTYDPRFFIYNVDDLANVAKNGAASNLTSTDDFDPNDIASLATIGPNGGKAVSCISGFGGACVDPDPTVRRLYVMSNQVGPAYTYEGVILVYGVA